MEPHYIPVDSWRSCGSSGRKRPGMDILLIRHEADGSSWKEYPLDFPCDWDVLLGDLKADLNTPGITRLEILMIPQG